MKIWYHFGLKKISLPIHNQRFIKINFKMKKGLFSILTLVFAVSFIQAQEEKDKDLIKVDIENGTINGLKPAATMDEIKKTLPFFTDETAENQGINCDGGVFYMNNDVYFYTARDYVDIKAEFKGKLSKDILNKNIQEVTKLLGTPDHQIKPAGDDESMMVVYFKMPYGCLRLNYNISTGNVFEIAMHTKPINEAMLDLCF